MSLQLELFDPPYLYHKRLYQELRRLKEAITVEMSIHYAKSQQLCTHEKTHTVDHYYPGDYFNTDYTDINKVCSLCEKIIGTKRKEGNSYG